MSPLTMESEHEEALRHHFRHPDDADGQPSDDRAPCDDVDCEQYGCQVWRELDALRMKLDDVTECTEGLRRAWDTLGALPVHPGDEHVANQVSQDWIQQYPEEIRPKVQHMVAVYLSGAVRALVAKLQAGPPGGRNYVTVAVVEGERAEKRYSLTLQREDGLSPATVIADLQADNDVLRARIAAFEAP